MENEHIIFFNLLLAVILGAFIGLERDLPKENLVAEGAKHSDTFGGVRSFAMISVLGAISVFMDTQLNVFLFSYFSLFLVAVFVVSSYLYSSFKKGAVGLTSEYAALATYFVGMIVMMENYTTAFIFTILLVIVLASKEKLEKFKSTLSREELKHTITFAAIAFVVLPLLPDEKYSFATLFAQLGFTEGLAWSNKIWQVTFFNPYSLWFFVVIMSAVGYVGYMLSKYLGTKSGVIVSSMVGGLVSSTAVTAAMTARSKKDVSNYPIYIVGTLLANCIMLARVIFIVLLFNFALLTELFIPIFMMFMGLSLATFYFYRKGKAVLATKTMSFEKEIKSPFSIVPAIQFGLFVLLIKFIAAFGLLYKDIWGESIFYYVLGVISGLADVDAITQTISVQAGESLIPFFIASITIFLAASSNNVVKGTIAYKFGEKNFGSGVALSLLVSIIFGLVGLGISYLI